MNLFAIVNGTVLPAEQAALSVRDLAVQRGYGVFDYFRTLRGRPIFWADHLDRLFNSCRTLRLPLPFDRAGLMALLLDLMRRNGLADSGIRITVTGGDAADGYTIGKPNVVIVQGPLPPIDVDATLHLMTFPHQRQLPAVKSLDYLMAIYLKARQSEMGAQDSLYHHNGLVTESPRSTFFIVTEDGALATAGRDVLDGVTRRRVLELAQGLCKVEARDVHLEELVTAREAFITGTSKKIVPVTRIDGQPVGNGKVGDLTRLLTARLDDRIEQEIAG